MRPGTLHAGAALRALLGIPEALVAADRAEDFAAPARTDARGGGQNGGEEEYIFHARILDSCETFGKHAVSA